jgi:hypothetical protein
MILRSISSEKQSVLGILHLTSLFHPLSLFILPMRVLFLYPSSQIFSHNQLSVSILGFSKCLV